MTLLNTIQSISGINHHQAEGLTDHNWGHRPQIRAILTSYARASSLAASHRPQSTPGKPPDTRYDHQSDITK